MNVPERRASRKLPALLANTTSTRVSDVVPRNTRVSLRRSKAVAIAREVKPAAKVDTVTTVANPSGIGLF